MARAELREIEVEGGTYYQHVEAKVDQGAIVGQGTYIWEGAHIFEGAKVGAQCVIGAGVHIESGAELGDFGKVQRGVVLYNGIKAEDYVFFGPNATTTNDRNPTAYGPWEPAETVIGIGASISANATLIAGNNIGPMSLVASGAVVTKPVRAGEIVAGNPARHLGWRNVSGRLCSRELEIPDEVITMLDNPRLAIENYLEEMNA